MPLCSHISIQYLLGPSGPSTGFRRTAGGYSGRMVSAPGTLGPCLIPNSLSPPSGPCPARRRQQKGGGSSRRRLSQLRLVAFVSNLYGFPAYHTGSCYSSDRLISDSPEMVHPSTSPHTEALPSGRPPTGGRHHPVMSPTHKSLSVTHQFPKASDFKRGQ